MAWTLARSLKIFQAQLDQKFPKRAKPDGTIGDAAHSARASDHNPDEDRDVCAIDITHDPDDGLSCHVLAEALRKSKDPRIKYIIWNRKIANPDISDFAWRPYNGANPHTLHMHLSVKQDGKNSEKLWTAIDNTPVGEAPAGIPAGKLPPLKYGLRGDAVGILQLLLGVSVSGTFDKKTEQAVKDYQKAKGLVPDGIVGPYTWASMVGKTVNP